MPEIISPGITHFEPWARLMNEYFDFYKFAVDDNHLQKVFCKIQAGLIQSILAYKDGVAVGVANYIFNQSTFCNLECYLSDLYIDEDYRGHKIAELIMDRVFENAQSSGCKNVHWITAADNTSAQALYDRIAIRSNFIMYQRDL